MSTVTARFATLLLFFTVLTCAQLARADDPLRLVVPNFRPYSYLENNTITGLGVKEVTKVLTSLKIDYRLELVPNYGRALEELKQGRADGFFLATQNRERDQIAQLSTPITFNRWSWFLPKDSRFTPSSDTFKQTAITGTILNTNTHKWLTKNGYKVGFTAKNGTSLISVLSRNRVDAVFIAQSFFLEAIKQENHSGQFKEIVEIKRPFGVYFSRKFLANKPDFMNHFNMAVNKLVMPLNGD